MNLLRETLRDVHESGHMPEDVVFIGSRESGYRCTWDEFVRLADVDYDAGYGAAEVATDLEIVFADGGHLRREEYDGSEGWTYISAFVEPKESKPISRLTVAGLERVGWVNLADMHEKSDY